MIEGIKTVNNFDFKNQIALMRVDFNVPIDKYYNITDDTRIQSTLPTIQKILSEKGKIILISHFGRPKGKPSKTYSLKFLIPFLSEKLKLTVDFCENCIGKNVEQKIHQLKNGKILLLENLRFYKEEEEGNENFAFELSKLGDIYVNDAFGVSHRSHTSISLLPKFFGKKKCIGLLMQKEIQFLNKFLSGKGKKPITVILGGAKISSKIEIIENIIDFADHILIGGGMSYPFIKMKGGKIGNSIVEKNQIIEETLNKILNKCQEKNKKLSFPKDVIIADSFKNTANTKISSIHSIPDRWMGLDIGPSSIKYFCNIIEKSNTILWNGPVGVFEFPNFSLGTRFIAKTIAKRTEKGAFSLVGGGDSIASLKMEGCNNKISYLSTGGGALLESLKNKILPGIKAII
ncbi:phosphoglycerate kinase [Blattabacterium sp. (Blattella germanica) str. Bge]|uniref:phosphoglycerate kinase n=1 Tax=Blattabacterium sp. (Blattella germanica) TaxID=624186 RepID=UPI0001BB6170|nr:phosphoglycerate kinase [Blattabacterium sp. (Blattella germanica)]ACY40314.1 phosphoglycerate kinase [Blattabacterium sp. (Blattella germanica) str. Bge]